MSLQKYNFEQPDFFLSTINILQQQFVSVLDDYKKYYVLFKINKKSSEYNTIFQNIKTTLSNINTQIDTNIQLINSNIININNYLLNINNEINTLKNDNKMLQYKLKTSSNNQNSTDEMVDDYITLYNLQYMNNFTIIVGFVILFISYKKIFTTK